MVLQAPSVTDTTTLPTTYNVMETDDYSRFKFLKHNRPVVLSHVARLAQSMIDKPHLRPARPILCNEKMEVIDGQHRLRGSEMNGQTVFYMVVPGLTIEDARLLNALQRTWGLLDYAYSYASSRLPAYVQFIKTYEARELPPSVIMEFIMGGNSRQRYDFRIGKMQVADQKALDAKLDNLELVVEAFPKGVTPYIVSTAYHVASRSDGFDPERMLKKLGGAKPSLQPDRVSYIRELERIYNADVQFNGPNYVRFFG